MPGLEKREACATGTKPSAVYSQSLIVGEMVYLSGIKGVNWATGGDLVMELWQILQHAAASPQEM